MSRRPARPVCASRPGSPVAPPGSLRRSAKTYVEVRFSRFPSSIRPARSRPPGPGRRRGRDLPGIPRPACGKQSALRFPSSRASTVSARVYRRPRAGALRAPFASGSACMSPRHPSGGAPFARPRLKPLRCAPPPTQYLRACPRRGLEGQECARPGLKPEHGPRVVTQHSG